MTWNFQLTDPAQKDFRKLPPKDQARVKAALMAMEQDPFQGDIKRLKGNPLVGVVGLGTIASSTTFISSSI